MKQDIDPIVVKSLGEKALIVWLSQGEFNFNKMDKKKSAEATKREGAKKGTGRVYKTLVNTKNPHVSRVRRAFYEMDKYHKTETIPYDELFDDNDDSFRKKRRRGSGRKGLLDSKKYFQYCQVMRRMKAECEESVANMVNHWYSIVAEAENDLGGFFNPKDYPTTAELADEYYVAFDSELIPMGKTANSLIGITDADKARLEETVNKRVEKALQKAMDDPWRRIHEAVSRVVDTLSDPDKTFRDSLVGNLASLVDVLPTLNLAEIPELDNTTRQIRDSLLVYAPKELREDKYAREETAEEAQKILDAMAPFYQA
jgi:hypothetical protein